MGIEQINHILAPITKPIYVMRKGWWMWGNEAKLKWLEVLFEACEQTQERINEEELRIRREMKA
jgi:hypothetical protein